MFEQCGRTRPTRILWLLSGSMAETSTISRIQEESIARGMENAKLLTKEYFERDREVQELIAKNHSLSQENTSLSQENAGLKRRLGDQERNK
jgi:uncharacterized tellurite resistance protein B-like protein